MPSQYADVPQTPDFTEIQRRTKGQYTTDVARTTLGDYSWEAPGKRPPATPRSSSWAGPGGGVSGGEVGGGGEPSRPVQVHVHQHPAPEFPGSGRDYNDDEVDPIIGSQGHNGGSPVLGGPSGPRPSMNGSTAVPEPVVEEAARMSAAGMKIPIPV
jgi:hypothetical protein